VALQGAGFDVAEICANLRVLPPLPFTDRPPLRTMHECQIAQAGGYPTGGEVVVGICWREDDVRGGRRKKEEEKEEARTNK
jgi:hypothetical protein